MVAITICSDFRAPQNKVWHCFYCFPIYLPWRDATRCHDLSFSECWVLSQLFHSPLAPSLRDSLVPLCFLPSVWYHLHILKLLIFLPTILILACDHPPNTFSSVQFSRSVVSNSLRPHGPQHTRPPCPSPNPRVYSNSCPLSWWCQYLGSTLI